MKLVYKIFFIAIAFVKKAFSAYKDYCCRKAKNKRKINYFKEARMRANISLAKTEMEARVLGYTHEEWVEYQESLKPVTTELTTDEGGDENV